jgi:hypothetical protein
MKFIIQTDIVNKCLYRIHSEDGARTFSRNVGKLLQDYMASHPRIR